MYLFTATIALLMICRVIRGSQNNSVAIWPRFKNNLNINCWCYVFQINLCELIKSFFAVLPIHSLPQRKNLSTLKFCRRVNCGVQPTHQHWEHEICCTTRCNCSVTLVYLTLYLPHGELTTSMKSGFVESLKPPFESLWPMLSK